MDYLHLLKHLIVAVLISSHIMDGIFLLAVIPQIPSKVSKILTETVTWHFHSTSISAFLSFFLFFFFFFFWGAGEGGGMCSFWTREQTNRQTGRQTSLSFSLFVCLFLFTLWFVIQEKRTAVKRWNCWKRDRGIIFIGVTEIPAPFPPPPTPRCYLQHMYSHMAK